MLTKNLVKVLVIVFGLLAVAGLAQRARSATTLLPNGEQCFQTGAGPVVSGSVNMYSVGTTTPKTTWTNSSQSATNTNPIQLDANGCAIIYGVGSYRQQLWSGPVVGGVATGTLIYDLTTTDTSAANSTFWAGTAAGTPNAITVVDTGFANTDGSVINFLASATNTAATTLNVSGGGAINVEQITGSGPAALTAGCIVTNNPVSVIYSSTLSAFVMLTACPPVPSTAANVFPGGYLSLSTDPNGVVAINDMPNSTAVFYYPYIHNELPIWNGATFQFYFFGALTLNLTASHLSGTIYDVFAFANAGSPTLITGPAWANSAAGTGARGTGAGTTQINRVGGIYVNTVAMTGTNGATTYPNIPVSQATYLGSIFIDSTPGQVTTQTGYGQTRKWDVWNNYNRQVITLNAGDPTVNWTYNTSAFRASNNSALNNVTVFTGLAEENPQIFFNQVGNSTAGGQQIAIAVNNTTTFAGMLSEAPGFNGVGSTTSQTMAATGLMLATSIIGQNQLYMLEKGPGSGTNIFQGTNAGMQLSVKWRG